LKLVENASLYVILSAVSSSEFFSNTISLNLCKEGMWPSAKHTSLTPRKKIALIWFRPKSNSGQ